nr:RNA-dependent RNA polymerase [Flumine narna-like virus 9]
MTLKLKNVRDSEKNDHAIEQSIDQLKPTKFGFGSTVIEVAGEISRVHVNRGFFNTKELLHLYPNDNESVMKVCEAVKCLIEIYHIFGLRRINKDTDEKESHNYYKCLLNLLIKVFDYMKIQGKNAWIPYFKYKTCSMYAFYEKQDLPASPEGLIDIHPNIMFGGVVGKYQHQLLLSNKKKYESFILTINMAKMGMPRASDSMVKEAELKMMTHLTTTPPPLDESQVIIDLNFREQQLNKVLICQELKRTTRELFEGITYRRVDHYEPFFPSTSANYNRSRGDLGAVASIKMVIENDCFEYLSGDTAVSKQKESLVKLKLSEAKARGQIAENFGNDGKSQQEIFDNECDLGQQHNINAIDYDYSDLQDKWTQLMDELEDLAFKEEPLVEPVGLAEALKIRVISKGPPLTYSYLKPLQKFMWRTLKSNKVFEMISTPITVEHVRERIGYPREDEQIVNGDYKASTDNLHSWVSECIANELVDVINESDSNEKFIITDRHREMFIRSLINHVFQLPDGKGNKLAQKEGQLMGSVTSFPILCIANAAFCRYALECSNHIPYRLCDRPLKGIRTAIAPLLINGDDCTLKGSRFNLKSNWEMITRLGGLSTSVGKTLYSLPEKPIVVLNSTTFHLIEGKWEEIKFVNMGILEGRMRSGNGKDSKRSYHMLGALQAELKASCPDEVWTEANSVFMKSNMSILKQFPTIPWAAPNYLGGPQLIHHKVNGIDNFCASLLIMQIDSTRFSIRKPVVDATWKIHELVQKRLDEYEVKVPENFLEVRRKKLYDNNNQYFTSELMNLNKFDLVETTYSKLYKYLCIDALFTNNLDTMAKCSMKSKTHKVQAASVDYINFKRMTKNVNSWNNAWDAQFNQNYELRQAVRVREWSEIEHEKRQKLMAVVASACERVPLLSPAGH